MRSLQLFDYLSLFSCWKFTITCIIEMLNYLEKYGVWSNSHGEIVSQKKKKKNYTFILNFSM